MKKMIVGTFIFASIGLVLGIVSAALYYYKMDCYGAVGAFSTVISIILAVVSMVYTFYSSKETSDLFECMDQKLNELDKQIEKIDEQNHAFVDKIKMELSKENYDRANIDNVRNKK